MVSQSEFYLPRLALTVGEPAGIGVDISLQLAQHALPAQLIAIADPAVLQQRAQQLGLNIILEEYQVGAPRTPHRYGHLSVLPIKTHVPVITGQLDPRNADYVLSTLERACQGCIEDEFDAIVTAPVHKGVINQAGVPFTGHTEFFAEKTNTEQVVMLLTTVGLSVALVTTHIPLARVPSAITPERLATTLRIVNHDFKSKFGIVEPRILVCGLNPHAGENGYLGDEEITIINPVLEQLRAEGMRLIGAVPADTAFTPASLVNIDVVVAMYHDQGLAPLKQRGFGNTVNVTLGLPIIRTSVDHGTALELAGTGKASSDSLKMAVQVALDMVIRKQRALHR